jgi:hypothetical protein
MGCRSFAAFFRMVFVGNSPFFVFMGNASYEKEPARSAADGNLTLRQMKKR